MTVPRRILVDRSARGLYHCISRCVRRAFLCGGEFEHRKSWVRDRLRQLADVFAVDVAAYAVMSNHLHVIVRTDPAAAARWSDLEVVTRWSRLFPASVLQWASASTSRTVPTDELTVEHAVPIVAADSERVVILRDRLSNLSWLMKCLKEPIARRANREDGCTGCFWEGRFKSPRLLDEAAVLTGMVYVDLNPLRAGIAATPEQSGHTSVQDRVHVRQLYEKQRGRRRRSPRRARHLRRGSATLTTPEDGIWLAPIERRPGQGRVGILSLTLDEYLEVVDVTGRLVRSRNCGSIPASLPPILERLSVNASVWANMWSGVTGGVARIFGTAVGCPAAREAEAQRRGCTRVVGVLGPPARAT